MPLELLAAVSVAVIATVPVAAFGAAWWMLRHEAAAPAPWTAAELARMPREQTGRHRAGGERGHSEAYQPRHGLDEVPPSIREPIEAMSPVERAKELTRQLGNQLYSPWRGLADRRLRIRLQAATIARRHGLPLLLGTFRREVALP